MVLFVDFLKLLGNFYSLSKFWIVSNKYLNSKKIMWAI